jgi:hypothetical protein
VSSKGNDCANYEYIKSQDKISAGSRNDRLRFEKLKSILQTSYNTVRENTRKAHATKKRYYDARAKARNCDVWHIVYLLSAAIKAGLNSTFRQLWSSRTESPHIKSELRYETEDPEVRTFVEKEAFYSLFDKTLLGTNRSDD